MTSQCASTFLHPGHLSQADSLAVLHLNRDQLVPVTLEEQDLLDEGYAEGKVTNTRFGSFPHSTLIGVPWGTQVRASAVDTGSRGRRGTNGTVQKGVKRKRPEDVNGEAAEEASTPKTAVTAATGFIHLLPPTPESWTSSLPHRTQVVYTPDYSYILDRLRVRPGSAIIEAGAGSGSFTHAAARAVFNGYPPEQESRSRKRRRFGQVLSYEFHAQRVDKLKAEVKAHGLEGVVRITHRDVCQNGFSHAREEQGLDEGAHEATVTASEPRAQAIFLDLPAPWLALRHLSRSAVSPRTADVVTERSVEEVTPSEGATDSSMSGLGPKQADLDNGRSIKVGGQITDSPLDPKTTVRLCTFSPCIEQVQRTISTLRQLGWIDIEMVEIAARRVEVRRDRVGINEEGRRGVTASPATVSEAVTRLKEVEGRFKSFHGDTPQAAEMLVSVPGGSPTPLSTPKSSKLDGIGSVREEIADRKLYKEGRLVHRAEQELKTHTSYLVFALLPREWTVEAEEKCRLRWPAEVQVTATDGENLSRRHMKKAAKSKAGGNKAHEEMQEQVQEEVQEQEQTQEQATVTGSTESLQHDQKPELESVL